MSLKDNSSKPKGQDNKERSMCTYLEDLLQAVSWLNRNNSTPISKNIYSSNPWENEGTQLGESVIHEFNIGSRASRNSWSGKEMSVSCLAHRLRKEQLEGQLEEEGSYGRSDESEVDLDDPCWVEVVPREEEEEESLSSLSVSQESM